MKIYKDIYDFGFYYYSRLKNIVKYRELRAELYSKKNICNLKIPDNVQKQDLFKDLKKNYKGLIKINGENFFVIPTAILKIPETEEKYLSMIKSQSRNKINKAIKNNIVCKNFVWNDFLDDIYEIHKSKAFRQGKLMSKSYLEYPKSFNDENELAEVIHLGAFQNEKLVGYVEWFRWGNFAATNRLLGHGDFLKLGIMNLLFFESCKFSLKNNIEYLAYYTMLNNSSLDKFKKNIGFKNFLIKWDRKV